MDATEFGKLAVGDLIQRKNRLLKGTYVVTGITQVDEKVIVTAVDTIFATNPPEWELVSKANHENPTQWCGTYAYKNPYE